MTKPYPSQDSLSHARTYLETIT